MGWPMERGWTVEGISHAPEGYVCPFCLIAGGVWDPPVLSAPTDLVYQDQDVSALISARQWPGNPGHVLILPNEHHEHLYSLPDSLGARIHQVARRVALAMKLHYRCEGISTRQHNEPAGNQDVWHYHLHVFPRYAGDELYQSQGVWMPEQERAAYADTLRAALGGDGTSVSVQEQALALIRSLPDDCTLEDIQYHLSVRARVEHGIQAVDEGRVLPQEEAESRLGEWLRSSGSNR